ncbi:hypothetical protein [Flavobacterium aestivum]|uniref:hypothetical protein n=1 Tax=Flavobacterium aestivum TaxID=3003257 RepID=UPI0024832029|nr:hypothetical protein [Flavobacterium aestivum]
MNNLKPGDFFFGLMEFLAYIVPGFILCITLPIIKKYCVFDSLNIAENEATAFTLLSFILISYILGHFIHHICAMALNPIYEIVYLKRKMKKHASFINESEEVILKKLPVQIDLLKASEAYLRINHPNLIAELEKHEANSKLFRSLSLLSLYLCFFSSLNWIIISSLIVISILSFNKFANQRWTHRYLVYQYFLIATEVK